MKKMCRSMGAAGALLVLAGAVQAAGEVYGGIGLPGLMLGYAQPLNERFTVRGDVATLGSRSVTRTENVITYSGKLKAQRAGVFADWFAFSGGFRVTGGVTFNQFSLDLGARTNSGDTITIDNTAYTQGGSLDISVKFPSTTPYLGIGWGHHSGKGLGVVWDLGASIGRATVKGTLGGALATAVPQSKLDAELADIRDGVGKIRILPQVSLALNYRF